MSIVRRIKDSFGWPGEVRTISGACACIGELPKIMSEGDHTNFSMSDLSSTSMPLVASEEEMKALEDIASYQVPFLFTCFWILCFHDVGEASLEKLIFAKHCRKRGGGLRSSIMSFRLHLDKGFISNVSESS